MARGERFVQEVLRGKARARERWMFGLPAAILALVGLGWLARLHRWRPSRRRSAEAGASQNFLAA
jgi:hypothetical protein